MIMEYIRGFGRLNHTEFIDSNACQDLNFTEAS